MCECIFARLNLSLFPEQHKGDFFCNVRRRRLTRNSASP
jgi:hypothetical protein